MNTPQCGAMDHFGTAHALADFGASAHFFRRPFGTTAQSVMKLSSMPHIRPNKRRQYWGRCFRSLGTAVPLGGMTRAERGPALITTAVPTPSTVPLEELSHAEMPALALRLVCSAVRPFRVILPEHGAHAGRPRLSVALQVSQGTGGSRFALVAFQCRAPR